MIGSTSKLGSLHLLPALMFDCVGYDRNVLKGSDRLDGSIAYGRGSDVAYWGEFKKAHKNIYEVLMATIKQAKKPLIFVDTNIFLDFYRLGGGSSKLTLLDVLLRHADLLITGSQIEMEFKKNRQVTIRSFIKNNTAPDFSQIKVPAFLADASISKTLSQQTDSIKKTYKKIQANLSQVLHNPSEKDPVYVKAQKIFKTSSPLNLNRTNELRFEIRDLAKKRFILGYPPRKHGDTSIGDAINWEWIIHCASKATQHKRDVIIVSRDGDYGEAPNLNDWLRQEFKQRVGRKNNVFLTDRLAEAFKKMSINVSTALVEGEKSMLANLTNEVGTLAPQTQSPTEQGIGGLLNYLLKQKDSGST